MKHHAEKHASATVVFFAVHAVDLNEISMRFLFQRIFAYFNV